MCAGSGAAGLQGAVVVAVDELVPVGPGDGGLVPIVHQVGEGGSPAHRGLALQIVEACTASARVKLLLGTKVAALVPCMMPWV